jgi:Tfp pilus assembly protein PilF
MSTFAPNEKRDVIPRWLEYKIASHIGLLENHDPVNLKNNFYEFQNNPAFIDWIAQPNIGAAVDLISLSIICNDFDSVDAKNAANYLIKKRSSLYPVHVELAEYYLNPFKTEDISYNNNNYNKLIADLKKNLNDYPINALAWSDLSLLYAKKGNNEKSHRCAIIALNLSRNNKFILRNTSCCFLHSGDPERALDILRKSSYEKSDPLINSAEISIANYYGLKSKHINAGKNLVFDENISSFSRSELAAELATMYLRDSDIKKAKKLAKLSIIDPNENSLAQIEWCCKNLSFNPLFDIKQYNEVLALFEANAWHHYYKKNFKESLSYCDLWIRFQPLSETPILQASFIAITCLDDVQKTISIAENAKQLLKDSYILNNNYVVALLERGDTQKAKEIIDSIDINALEDLDRLTFLATQGMYYYRINEIEKAQELYKFAINEFDLRREYPTAAIATFYFALETKRALGRKNAEHIINDAIRRIKQYKVFVLEHRINEL